MTNQARPTAPLRAGESCQRTVRYTAEEIAQFARLSGDTNPVHSDDQTVRDSLHGRVIATGQQTAAQMIGLVSSHCSAAPDGHRRDVLCLNFNFAFKAPVFPDEDVQLQWRVSSIEWNERLAGWVGHVDGTAVASGRTCVIGRGTVLVKQSEQAAAAGKGRRGGGP
jgi:acyl dehydratase